MAQSFFWFAWVQEKIEYEKENDSAGTVGGRYLGLAATPTNPIKIKKIACQGKQKKVNAFSGWDAAKADWSWRTKPIADNPSRS